MRRPLRFALLLAAWGLCAPRLRAGLTVEGSALQGDGGYREKTLSADFHYAFPLEWDDPDIPSPFTGFWVRAQRTGSERDGAQDATFTTEGGAGIEIFQRSSFELSYWITPALSEQAGAYRARGWELAATAGWAGWIPELDPEPGRPPPDVETQITLSVGRNNHEERVAVSTRTVRWALLREDVLGLALGQTYWRTTTLRFFGENHAYDRDIRRLSQRLEFFPLRNTHATASQELLEGFVRRSWGADLTQFVGKYLELQGLWRRSSYESGGSSRSDTYRGRATVFLGLYFSIHGLYETFKAEGRPGTQYAGGGLAVYF